MSNIRLKDPIKVITTKVKECVEEACKTTYDSPWDGPGNLIVTRGSDKLAERIVELVEAKLREELNVE